MVATLPVVLPPVPRDPTVTLPAVPVFPPTVENVLAAVQYRKNVERSIGAWISSVVYSISKHIFRDS
jgi:hypothetical protein